MDQCRMNDRASGLRSDQRLVERLDHALSKMLAFAYAR